MKHLHILSRQDITDKETVANFRDIITSNQNTLLVCANKSVKDLLSDSIYPLQKNKKKNVLHLYSDVEFSYVLSNRVFQTKHYLSNIDCRYILLKQIEIQFKDNEDKLRIFNNIYYKLYELFRFMLFHNLDITDDIIKRISLDFSGLELDIFALYQGYCDLIENTVNSIRSAKTPILEEFIQQSNEPDGEFDTYQNKIKKELNQICLDHNVIILNGFLFFDDYYKYLIHTALEKEKDVYLTFKESKSSKLNTDVFYQHYSNIFDSHPNHEFKDPEILIGKDTALNYLKATYPDIKPCEIELQPEDNSIQIIRPFPDRDSELRYIIKDISSYLRNNSNDDVLRIKDLLDDLAVIISVQKNQYEDRISSVLQDVGVFVFKNNPNVINNYFKETIELTALKNIYYERQDFLEQDIQYKSGKGLTYEEKNNLFNIAYQGLAINRTERPIASYPIGQYIIQLYSILLDGMTIDGFKALLYSNWNYHIGVSTSRWDGYISQFHSIEVFFENQSKISDWLSTLKNLIEIKGSIGSNPIFKYHPLFHIKQESLDFFYELVSYLQALTEEITSISGGMQEHLKLLKEKIICIDNLITIKEENWSFEQKIIKKLYDTIERVNVNSIINHFDARYFAENIKNILNNDDDLTEEEVTTDLKLNVIKLVNQKKYSKVYFVMLEFNKYPRIYNKEKFPFTNSIMKILRDEKYHICCIPSDYYDLDFHLKLELYLFLNVLDFTQNHLIITSSENQYGNKQLPSVFMKDILEIFQGKIDLSDYRLDNERKSIVFTNQAESFHLKKLPQYHLLSLAKFKLCPKLYFHNRISSVKSYTSKFQLQFYFAVVLYCDTIERFKRYNYENKAVYSVTGKKSIERLLSCFEESWTFCQKAFPIFTKFEKEEIKSSAKMKIQNFIPNIIEHSVKGMKFTVLPAGTKKYKGNDYDLVITFDTATVSHNRNHVRISQEKLFLEFLVLKTNDDEEDAPIHYKDMVASLDRNQNNCDRINLTVKIIGKINRQFASERFAYSGSDCGIDRTNALVSEIEHYDFSKTNSMPSSYCLYCSRNDICMTMYEEKGKQEYEDAD